MLFELAGEEMKTRLINRAEKNRLAGKKLRSDD